MALTFLANLLCNVGVRSGELQLHAHRAVARRNVFDDAEGNDVAREAGVFDGLEDFENGLVVEHE